MDLDVLRNKSMRYIVGLTAGRSCRGIDAALIRVKGSGADLQVKVIKAKHFPYEPGIRTRLLVTRKDATEAGLLNFLLGERLAVAATEMLRVAHAELFEVDLIASAGHIVAHMPKRGGSIENGSLQVGEPAVIAERTGVPVISGFAGADIAAGGQGAPLSTFGNWSLFSRKDRIAANLHLGGITSMTVAPADINEAIGFEIGPGNLALDGAMRILTGGTSDMDRNGDIASKGVVIDEFLDFLLDHAFFAKVPPKSVGFDEFSPESYLRDGLAGRKDHSIADLMATVTAAMSYSIVRAFNRFVKPRFNVSRVIVDGGGAANDALLKRIRSGMPDVTVRTSDEYKLPCAELDAIQIAMLANETVFHHTANVPTATGAKENVVMGNITPA
jgi:anhydro-N-acetylmuramic acid kinase